MSLSQSKTVNKVEQLQDKIKKMPGHPSWKEEVCESLTSRLAENLRNISSDLGLLGCLIYTRLTRQFEQTFSANNIDRKHALAQMSFNPSIKGGVPITTDNFLTQVTL